MMDDSSIVNLYWQRDEDAITETASKYGKYCYTIAYSILGDTEDSNEVLNDTYMGAWNSMPDQRPVMLSTYLGKITRRLSFKIWRGRNAQKRGGGEIVLALEELLECIPSKQSIDEQLEAEALSQMINEFLLGLPVIERRVFIRRYWHVCSIAEICEQFGFSKSKVESMLHRTRGKLLKKLKKEGVFDEV